MKPPRFSETPAARPHASGRQRRTNHARFCLTLRAQKRVSASTANVKRPNFVSRLPMKLLRPPTPARALSAQPPPWRAERKSKDHKSRPRRLVMSSRLSVKHQRFCTPRKNEQSRPMPVFVSKSMRQSAPALPFMRKPTTTPRRHISRPMSMFRTRRSAPRTSDKKPTKFWNPRSVALTCSRRKPGVTPSV